MTAMPDQSNELRRTGRSAVRRVADRGCHDAATVHAILEEAYVAHVGFVVDGEPRVLPMTYGRIDDALYLHGAAGNDMLRALVDAAVCVTVTILDGLVLARSAFHHSMNYRSVVLFGIAGRVEDPTEKRVAFDAIVEHSVPGRSLVARPPTPSEMRATTLLRVTIDEGSAKVRAGGPNDEPDDLDLPVWAGQVPLRLVPGAPVGEPAQAGLELTPPPAGAFVR
jgi:uncharacterized protein